MRTGYSAARTSPPRLRSHRIAGIEGDHRRSCGAARTGWDIDIAAHARRGWLGAIFHGHAHGSEMPMDASGMAYGLGFMLATAVLHASASVSAS